MFTLHDILNRLCQIEVKGRSNLENLLWCIMAIEASIQADEKTETYSAENDDADGDGEIDG